MTSKYVQRDQHCVDISSNSCASCFYFKHKSDDEYAEARTHKEAQSWGGVCRFFPSPVKKKLEDWCGQYKYFNVFFYQK